MHEIRRALALITTLSTVGQWAPDAIPRPVQLHRVAVLGFMAPVEGTSLHQEFASGSLLRDEFRRAPEVSTIEPGWFEPAIRALRYDGSINLSTEYARRLGSAIGCDFFVIGKAETVSRARPPSEVLETIVAIMIVDGRSGRLATFDFIRVDAPSREESVTAACRELTRRSSGYVLEMTRYRRMATRAGAAGSGQPLEVVEDLPRDGSAASRGFAPPEFISRATPVYSDEADLANITATVEASVVFGAGGRIGDIEIVRWAGFGLDEAAIEAIRRLEFRPASREGRPVSVRGLVQYNFRPSYDTSPEITPREEPIRDLRDLFRRPRVP